MILRPFQQEARKAAKQAYREGKRAILYVAPTGSGKTVILGDVYANHVRHQPEPRAVLYVHRRELVTQAAAAFRAFGLDVGCFGEGAAAPVQIVMAQTALARGEVEACTLAGFDEAHHYAADEWGTLVAAHKGAGAVLVGATATPERGDGRGLGHIFDHIVVVSQVRALVGAGYLVPCEYQGPVRAVPKGKIAMHPLKAHQRFAGNRRNVIFCPNLKAAREWQADFLAAGTPAEIVWGNQATDEREATLDRFRRGEVRVLLNCYVLTEGWDCPEVGAVTIARPCGSSGMLIQMAGRGARPCVGKASYTLIDLRGACYTFGRPDDDRTFSLDALGISSGSGTGVVGERACKMCKKPIVEDVCPYCGKDNGQEVPGDAGIEVGPWDGKRSRDRTPEARAKQLVVWWRRFPGKDHQFYAYRYKSVYGQWPDGEVYRIAKGMSA